MFSSNTHNIRPIGSYAAALKFFTDQPKVRSYRWGKDARPLSFVSGARNTRATQYRIEESKSGASDQYAPDYFDLVLYNTPLVRYMRPVGDTHVVYLNNYNSVLTRKFLAQHGWAEINALNDARSPGARVVVPLNYFAVQQQQRIDGLWLARLAFKGPPSYKQLIIEESDHVPAHRQRSTDNDRDRRAAVRKKLDLLHDMLWLAIDDKRAEIAGEVAGIAAHANTWQMNKWVGPGRGFDVRLHTNDQRALYSAKYELVDEHEQLTPPTIAALVALYEAAYFMSLAKKKFNADKKEPTPTTAADMRRATTAYLLRVYRMDMGSGFTPLPKFTPYDKFPHRTYKFKHGLFD